MEGLVGAVLVERLQAFGGEQNADALIELRHKNLVFLEIGLSAHFAAGIELRSTRAVAVATADFRRLMRYGTCFGHIGLRMVPSNESTGNNDPVVKF